VAGHARKETHQFPPESVKQPVGGNGVAVTSRGPYTGPTEFRQSERVSFGMDAVERSDDQHRIVYGTIGGESPGLGKALKWGRRW
jgi:hypothetical protein